MSSLSTSSNTSMRFVSMTTEEAFRLLNLAASLLQANIKMFLQRKKYLTFTRRHRAARKIQAIWRGYYTRNLDTNVQKLRHEFFIKIMQQNLELHYERNKNNNEEFKQQQMIIINILEELIKTNLFSVNHTPSECDNKTDNDVTSIESLIKETCNQVDELTVQDESLPYDSLLVYDENETQIDIIQLNNEEHFMEKQTLKTKVAWDNQVVTGESKSQQRDESDDKEVHISTPSTQQSSEKDKDNDFYDENTLNQVDSNMLPCDSESVMLPCDSESNMLSCDSESVMLPCDRESVMLPCNSKSVRLPCNSERVTLPCDSGINIESHDMTKLPAVTVSSEKDSSKVHLSNDEQIKIDDHPSDSSLSLVTKVLVELMHDTLKNIDSKELHSHESL